MKVVKARTRNEIARLREAAYLGAWPAHKQFEAMQDRDAGRPAKWNAMQTDFAAIRTALPYPT